MPLFKALGFGVLIIILKFLLPDVLSEGERTTINMLRGVSASAVTATSLIEESSSATAPRALRLPKAPVPSSF